MPTKIGKCPTWDMTHIYCDTHIKNGLFIYVNGVTILTEDVMNGTWQMRHVTWQMRHVTWQMRHVTWQMRHDSDSTSLGLNPRKSHVEEDFLIAQTSWVWTPDANQDWKMSHTKVHPSSAPAKIIQRKTFHIRHLVRLNFRRWRTVRNFPQKSTPILHSRQNYTKQKISRETPRKSEPHPPTKIGKFPTWKYTCPPLPPKS